MIFQTVSMLTWMYTVGIALWKAYTFLVTSPNWTGLWIHNAATLIAVFPTSSYSFCNLAFVGPSIQYVFYWETQGRSFTLHISATFLKRTRIAFRVLLLSNDSGERETLLWYPPLRCSCCIAWRTSRLCLYIDPVFLYLTESEYRRQ